MSFEADFYKSTDIFQNSPELVWDWTVASMDRYLSYSVVPRQANSTVQVTSVSVSTDNDLRPTGHLVVRLSPAPGLINFFAIRIPS